MMDVSDLALQLRARLAANQSLVDLFPKTRDARIKRITEFLSNVPNTIPQHAQDIVQIRADDPRKYFGFHPRLRFLVDEMSKAVDFLVEICKRITMYLEHIRATTPGLLSESIHQLISSAVHEQVDLATTLCQAARAVYTAAICKPPGPGALADDPARAPPARGLHRGRPQPVGQHYDARWDPDARMPGTPHAKFLRFRAPGGAIADFDHFLLPEVTASLLENVDRKFDRALANLAATRRVDHDGLDSPFREASRFDAYARENRYNLDAFLLRTRTQPRNNAATAGPYVHNWQPRRSRTGADMWAPEDMNRAIAVLERGRQAAVVHPMETGCQVVVDTRRSREEQE